MNFTRKSRKDISIDLTPLIDVVFLLLIFFMVSTSFVNETQLSIQLPKAVGESRENQSLLQVFITAKGDIVMNDHALTNNEIDTVKLALVKSSKGNVKQPLMILADQDAPYQTVILVMDAAGQLGFSNLRMGTEIE